MIVAQNVTKVFLSTRKKLSMFREIVGQIRAVKSRILALNDVCLAIKQGEIFGLLGPNGAGKTTFCKILNGLVVPTSGSIKIDGFDSIRDHRKIMQRMVTVFGGESDVFGIFAWRLSCYRNLRFVAELWKVPKKVSCKRIDYVLHMLDLEDKRDEWYQRLSAGTKQKLFFAVPFIIQPSVLILDEPTIRLDTQTRRKIYAIIKEHFSKELGITVLLTTHNMFEVEQLCDRVAILNKGKVVKIGSPRDIVVLGKKQETIRLII